MDFEKPEQYVESIEGTVEFGEEACCALRRAFEQNPGVVGDLETIAGDAKSKLFDEANEVGFIPSDEAKIVYSQIAKRELERIETYAENDDDISCGHTIDDHIWALKDVVNKMEPTIN